MKMCVDNKNKDFITIDVSVFAKVKVIGESIRLSVLEQPLRICDSLCKNRILDFQVVPNVTTVFENHRKSLIRHCQN